MNALMTNASLELEYLDIQGDSEAKKPLEIIEMIHEQSARILVDSDCSIYILDKNFANQTYIPSISTKFVSIQFTIRNASQTDL